MRNIMFKLPNPYTIDNQNERDEYLTNTLNTIEPLADSHKQPII